MRVSSFKLWEGDSIVQANIENKGQVTFWYGIDGVPRVDSIGSYKTTYDCFFINNQNQKTGYAYTTNLRLDKKSNFMSWFKFEINNMQDLVQRYEDITRVLQTFPKNPESIQFTNPVNHNFILTQESNGKKVVCDLFE